MEREPGKITRQQVIGLRRRLGRIAGSIRRNFPWRRGGITVFEYMVTEILLQQTRADMVARFSVPFFQRFTSWRDLHITRVDELAAILRPLGLYRQRATRLKQLAVILKHGTNEPVTFASLEKLPGVGQYVAGAVAARFGGEHQPMLDTNMVRLLQRYFGLALRGDLRRDRGLRKLATDVIAGPACLAYNFAILDIAALYCTSKAPRHRDCPLRLACHEYRLKPLTH